ncbi:MAG: helix-turn-helix transcriptional regulator [Kiritimatiellae bacterium]|nr:helix-turn-helix transcriptional regulator [Kiritimatiellia bacterium]
MPGDLIAFFPGSYVRYYDLPGHAWRYTWLELRGARAQAALERAGLRPDSPLRRGALSAPLRAVLDEIEAAYGDDRYTPFFPVAATWRLLDLLSGRQQAERGGRMDPSLAAAVKRLIDLEFRHPLSVGQIARELGTTRTTVFRHFRQAYDQSPKQYLDELRLNHARVLLRGTRMGVKEIARASGFRDAHYFGRAFCARFGAAPTAWRMRMAAANVVSRK